VFQVPEWSSAWNALPDGDRRKEFDFSVYCFIDPPVVAAGAVALDVGVNDDVNVLRFHAKERHANGTTFRWSRDVSYINLQGVTADDRTIPPVMDDGRRPVGAAGLGRGLDERSGAGTVAVILTSSPCLSIPPGRRAADRPAAVRLKLAPTWRPKAVLGAHDATRRHGRSRGRQVAGRSCRSMTRERWIAPPRIACRDRRRLARLWPRAPRLAAAAHPAAAPRAHRRPADVGGGDRVGAGAARRRRRSISSSAAGTERSPGASAGWIASRRSALWLAAPARAGTRA
jgi:hypothetical protein